MMRELQDESIAGHLLKEIERTRERREEMTKEREREEAERVERIRAAVMRRRQGLAGAAADVPVREWFIQSGEDANMRRQAFIRAAAAKRRPGTMTETECTRETPPV